MRFVGGGGCNLRRWHECMSVEVEMVEDKGVVSVAEVGHKESLGMEAAELEAGMGMPSVCTVKGAGKD